MAINFKKIWEGIKLETKAVLTLDSKGEVQVDDTTGKIHYHDGSTESSVVTEAHSATLTNKTIGDTNTINAQDDAFTIEIGRASCRERV